MEYDIKEKISRIIRERNLCSYMNNTKWNELIIAVKNEMSFPPPYDIKYLTQENTTQSNFENEDVYFWGDWDGEEFPTQEYYINIEWIKIRPRFLKHRGKLISPELVDESEKLQDILRRYRIPYEVTDGLYCIYGYR